MSRKDYDYIGKFVVNSGVVISDPCYSYDEDSYGSIVVKKAKKGIWHAEIEFDSVVGVVKELYVSHESCKEYGNIWGTLDGSYRAPKVGVDSGLMGVYDAQYFKDNQNSDYEVEGSWYRRICDYFKDPTYDPALIVDDRGAISLTGYGDGSYEVFVNYSGDEIDAVRIVFVEDEDEEEEDPYDEGYYD